MKINEDMTITLDKWETRDHCRSAYLRHQNRTKWIAYLQNSGSLNSNKQILIDVYRDECSKLQPLVLLYELYYKGKRLGNKPQ